MSYANRKRKYEQYKAEEGQPRLSEALKREFEGETADALETRKTTEKKKSKKKAG